MENILTFGFQLSLLTLAFWIASQKDMLLYWFRELLDSWVVCKKNEKIQGLQKIDIDTTDPLEKFMLKMDLMKVNKYGTWHQYLAKPLLLCAACMCSIWGLGFGTWYKWFHGLEIETWFFGICFASILNAFLSLLFNRLR